MAEKKQVVEIERNTLRGGWTMGSRKPRGKKVRLVKAGKQTRWAPFWTVPKKYGAGKKVHPGRHTTVKRQWRRRKIQA